MGGYPYCRQFPNKEKLKEHTAATHHEKDASERTCNKCDKVLKSKYSRDLHYRTHFRVRRNEVECSQCPKKFKDNVLLNKHVKRFHNKDSLEVGVGNEG